MKTKKRQKICYNCDGQVDLDVIVCPFCGTDLLEEFDVEHLSEKEDFLNRSLSEKETISSLYPPLYQPEKDVQDYPEDHPEEPIQTQRPLEEDKQVEQPFSIFFPTFFISLAFMLFVLSFMIFFFSTNGIFHLKFQSKFCFLYLAFSGLFFYLGWKKLSSLDGENVSDQ